MKRIFFALAAIVALTLAAAPVMMAGPTQDHFAEWVDLLDSSQQVRASGNGYERGLYTSTAELELRWPELAGPGEDAPGMRVHLDIGHGPFAGGGLNAARIQTRQIDLLDVDPGIEDALAGIDLLGLDARVGFDGALSGTFNGDAYRSEVVDWLGLAGRFSVPAAQDELALDATAPGLKLTEPDDAAHAIHIQGMRLTGDQRLAAPALWLGDSELTVERFTVEAEGETVVLEDLGLDMRMAREPEGLSVAMGLRSGPFDLAGQWQGEALQFSTALSRIDWDSAVRLAPLLQRYELEQDDPQYQVELFSTLASSTADLLAAAPELRLGPLSLDLGEGPVASRLQVQVVPEALGPMAMMGEPEAILSALRAEFELEASRDSLVDLVAGALAGTMMTRMLQQGELPDDDMQAMLEAQADAEAAQTIRGLEGAGLLVPGENGGLSMLIRMDQGQFSLNGESITLAELEWLLGGLL
ncbi:uncharacterized protein YdgA (DUF945 family) [Alkalispirillum mobile]|uniref:Uncharacterized protein YdgA (DUF945 family) n=1 Tax=Alkalispirillum mobile TaxID=85925 RepID=A0A498C5Q9_9GAMM|nr:DUF945 family protein [Alkalispirillum mobile]RLK51155.1 uncharacterized protein YdgA (DUF945 family) [Alkalispirillum mobile]